MSESWKNLTARLDRLEREMDDRTRENYYPAASRRADQDLERRLERGSRKSVNTRLGDLSASVDAVVKTTFAWDTSYATGGEDATAGSLLDTVTSVLPMPKNGYTFQWNSGTDKYLAFTTAGTEVVATTDMDAAVGTIDVTVFGTSLVTYQDLVLYTSPGGEALLSIAVVVAADLDAHATNYWTFTAKRRKPGQEFGERLVERTTAIVGFKARKPVTLYANRTGLELGAGDSIILGVASATASTAGVAEPVVTLDIQGR